MRPLALLLPLLALACGPDGQGGSDAASSTGTAGATASSTGAPGTGGSTTATTGAPTTDTSSTTTTTAGVSTDPEPSTGDTGGPTACAVAGGDYGPCASELGWVYDGTECVLRSGCDCAPDCDKFFPDAAACALGCAAAGRCNEDRIAAAGLAKDPVGPGDLCDEIDVCPESRFEEQLFAQIFGMLSCEPQPGFPCESGKTCHGLFQNMLGPDEWQKTCAASLLQGGGPVFCVVWGP